MYITAPNIQTFSDQDYGLLYFPKKVSQQNTDKIKNEIVNISVLCLQSTAKVFKKTLANADEK